MHAGIPSIICSFIGIKTKDECNDYKKKKKRRGEKKQRRSTLLAVWREGDESSWWPFIIGPKVLAKGCPSLWVAVRLPPVGSLSL